MKFLKSTMAIVALLAIVSVNAKQTAKQGQYTTQTQTGMRPATQPTINPIIQPVIQPEAKPVTPTTPAPVFYDEITAMIKQTYLDNRAQTVLKANKNNQKKTITILTGELIKPMHKEWIKRNFKKEDIKPMQDIIVEQITNAVTEAAANPMMQEEEMSKEEMMTRRG